MLYWKRLLISPDGFIAKPVYAVRKTRLENPMLPERMRAVTQVLIESVGGKAWINVNERDIITKEQAQMEGLVRKAPETPQPLPQTPRPQVMPQLKGDPHRDPVFEALLSKRRLG